eukprot:TRINITY_DN6570_c2_g1_i2.p1 TRINITY_DN6570_c2_g1~~TRINITY_DN6570_c2_g1_i2.p1  ORF type:complete len:345 (+),score=65.66 TRINITY_DN6570_c2_g1_i2:45-1079(+)
MTIDYQKQMFYFLEKLNNIECFQISVMIPPDLLSSPSPTSTTTSSDNKPVINVRVDSVHCSWGSYSIEIKLDCQVDAVRSEYKIHHDFLHIKIPFHKDKQYVDDSYQLLLSVDDIKRLCCRACGQLLVKEHMEDDDDDTVATNNHHHKDRLKIHKTKQSKNNNNNNNVNKTKGIAKVLSLPSTYWVELADMWICGCCNNKFLQFPLEEIQARKTICYVGDTFILLHCDDIRDDSIQRSSLSCGAYGQVSGCETKSDWLPISCANCQEEIGLLEAVESDQSKYFNYKIYKHKISTGLGGIDQFNKLKRYTVETLCALNLLATSQAHQCYKFHICGTSHTFPHAQV